MTPRYVPDRGEIVWLQFNPQAGHEQAGHRPAWAAFTRIIDIQNSPPHSAEVN